MDSAEVLGKLCSDVVSCDVCLGCAPPVILRDEQFNVPQPGYVGDSYATKRVMFIGQNPGMSPERSRPDDTQLALHLVALARNASGGNYVELRNFLGGFMKNWSITQNYLRLDAFGLRVEEIAYLNVVRCRTMNNAAPTKSMADNCRSLHLGRWLDVLKPKVVIFLGKWARDASVALVQQREIPHGVINRDRSLSTQERQDNLAEIAKLLHDGTLPKATPRISSIPLASAEPEERKRAASAPKTSEMQIEVYISILRSLGFQQVERGKVLTHTKQVPSIYLNRRRDGFVFFTAYRKDSALYADRHVWLELEPQQVKDRQPQFMTVVPVAGKERYAFETLINRCN